LQRWRGVEEIPLDLGSSVVTVGVFDGVHRGHQHVIARTVEAAAAAEAQSVVVTFDPHPLEVVRPGSSPVLLSTLERRLELLEELGVEASFVLDFTPERSRQPAEDFVRDLLVGRLHAVRVVVGANFRFGHRAAGDTGLLESLGEQLGFDVDAVPLLHHDGIDTTWSSTYVRGRVAAGDVEAAAEALGRDHRVEGVVVEGDRRGRALGYPTANLDLPPHAAIPGDGVYAGWLIRDDERLPAAISVGTNPTFVGVSRRVEAHVLDRDDLSLYGRHVAVDFTARLRETLRFDSVQDLVARMVEDVERTRRILAPAQ
jgi:riboflavin kinase/FMN adenylyltransferase